MLHICVRKFDVTVTVQTFSQTKRSLTDEQLPVTGSGWQRRALVSRACLSPP